ncbi:MAG: M67 family metallopeptidase [Candidatus Promineifilaceae bacterium]|nr:M67 family metallopeptidase [Candidatus Promineifilaceae bacterium]
MLELTRALQARIEAQGAETYPYEGCGLLLGHSQAGRNVAVDIFPVPNRWEVEEEKPVRFRIDPQDMMRAELTAAERDLDVIGVYHSHPDHPPVASPRDLAWAAWPGYSYLITEVRQGQPALSRSWQLSPDRAGFEEEPLLVND